MEVEFVRFVISSKVEFDWQCGIARGSSGKVGRRDE